MKRVVVKLRIRAGRVGDYLLAHRAVPPELVDLYREAGIEERWQARMKPLMEPTRAPQDVDREGPVDWEEAFHFD